MSTEPTNPPAGSSWGDAPPAAAAEPSAKKTWSGRKTAVAIGVAVVIAGGGGAAIAIGTSGNSTAAQGQGPGQGPGGGGRNFGGGPGGGAGGTAALRNALHGDFVVTDPTTGGYSTERLQTGSITDISDTSVSLTSKDGYKQVYTIDASTVKTGTPQTGETVTVIAKVVDTKATAVSLGAATAPRGGGQGGPPPGGQGRPTG